MGSQGDQNEDLARPATPAQSSHQSCRQVSLLSQQWAEVESRLDLVDYMSESATGMRPKPGQSSSFLEHSDPRLANLTSCRKRPGGAICHSRGPVGSKPNSPHHGQLDACGVLQASRFVMLARLAGRANRHASCWIAMRCTRKDVLTGWASFTSSFLRRRFQEGVYVRQKDDDMEHHEREANSILSRKLHPA